MPVDWTTIADHDAVALSRLLSQFRGKPRFAALIRALVSGVQTLEDDADDLITLRTLDAATGASLDQYGAIVGEQRGALADDDYRRFIRARILINRSRGTPDDLAAILALLFGVDVLDNVSHYEAPPLTIVFEVVDPAGSAVSTDVARRIARCVNDARAAAHRVDVIEVYDAAAVFRFDTPGQGFDGAHGFARTIRGV